MQQNNLLPRFVGHSHHQNCESISSNRLRSSFQLLLSMIVVCCALAQPHTVDGTPDGHLAPVGPNSPLASIRSDPNFLRFGRSGALNEFNSVAHQTPTRTSSNFLRFGKSLMMPSASEPNFLRFGRQKGVGAGVGVGVDPTFLRFGRANNNFLRFGRAVGDEFLASAVDDDAAALFSRDYRQANPNFLRFG